MPPLRGCTANSAPPEIASPQHRMPLLRSSVREHWRVVLFPPSVIPTGGDRSLGERSPEWRNLLAAGVPSLRDSDCLIVPNPGLTPWANACRPYGAALRIPLRRRSLPPSIACRCSGARFASIGALFYSPLPSFRPEEIVRLANDLRSGGTCLPRVCRPSGTRIA